MASTGGRLAKVELLAGLLKQAALGEIVTAIAFLSGSTRQQKLGAGYATIQAAHTGTQPAQAATLTLGEVDGVLEKLASSSGAGSSKARAALLRDLFGRATEAERSFLFRLLIGELRQGALEGLMAEAVARAAGQDAGAVRRAAMLTGDLGLVAHAVLTEGAAGLERHRIQLFRPIQPMLAQPAEDIGEALGAAAGTVFEYKLDGARIQVHKSGDEVRVFSRLLNDVTVAVPEVVEAARSVAAREAILDGEAIALRPDGTPHPFQVTMRRFGRRLDVPRLRAELPLSCVFFDLLYRDGVSLLDEPQERRAAALAEIVPATHQVKQLVTSDRAKAEAFFALAIAEGHEGLMAKALDAPYQAGARGASWLKIKSAHTLDLVVLAAEWGHGRRKGWLSNLHLGARDPATGGFVMLGKTFKGMTDQVLAWQTERLQQLATSKDDFVVHVRPELVVEVAFNDVQVSTQYPGGVALRFARIKAYREDKTAAQADTIDTVRSLLPRG